MTRDPIGPAAFGPATLLLALLVEPGFTQPPVDPEARLRWVATELAAPDTDRRRIAAEEVETWAAERPDDPALKVLVAPIAAALADEDRRLRVAAALALGRMARAIRERDVAVQILPMLAAVLAEPEAPLRRRAAEALRHLAGSWVANQLRSEMDVALRPLTRALTDADADVRKAAVAAFALVAERAYNEGNGDRATAAAVLGPAVRPLADLLSDGDAEVRRWAARGLQEIGQACTPARLSVLTVPAVAPEVIAVLRPAIPPLEQRLTDDDLSVRLYAASALRATGFTCEDVSDLAPAMTLARAGLLSDDPEVRRTSVWTLSLLALISRNGVDPVVTALSDVVRDDPVSLVRSAAVFALASVVEEPGRRSVLGPTVQAMVTALGDGDAAVRDAAGRALGPIQTQLDDRLRQLIIPALLERLTDEDEEAATTAAYVLADAGAEVDDAVLHATILQALLRLLRKGYAVQTAFAIIAPAVRDDKALAPPVSELTAALQNGDEPDTRVLAAAALGAIGENVSEPTVLRPAVVALVAAARDADTQVRRCAAEFLARVGVRHTEPAVLETVARALTRCLKDREVEVRRHVVATLDQCLAPKDGRGSALDPLVHLLSQALKDVDMDVSVTAHLVLRRLDTPAARAALKAHLEGKD